MDGAREHHTTFLKTKTTSMGITIPDIRVFYRAIMIKTAWYWHRDRQMDQWNRIEDSEITPHTMPLYVDNGKKKIGHLAVQICNVQIQCNPIKISTQFIIEVETAILKFRWNNNKYRISKTSIKTKRTGKITIPECKQVMLALLQSNRDKTP